jgi:hypothetical protein
VGVVAAPVGVVVACLVLLGAVSWEGVGYLREGVGDQVGYLEMHICRSKGMLN